MHTIADRFEQVQARVGTAARAVGRDPAEVTILVATKTQPPQSVVEVVAAGATLIGENRVQELTAKAPAIHEDVLAGRVAVHLIGPLQTNKINHALGAASCIETIDSVALAHAVSSRCVRSGISVQVMVQVNVSGEPTKSGCLPDDAAHVAAQVAVLPGLTLTGFMTIGANVADAAVVRAGFARLRAIRDTVVASGQPGTGQAVELSMGMSGDLELAIAEGATIVRVGSAVFGARAPRVS